VVFKIGKSLFKRRREVYNFCAALEYVFTEIYWSLDEVILERYWRVLYSVFKVVTKNYNFSNMFSPLPLELWQLRYS